MLGNDVAILEICEKKHSGVVFDQLLQFSSHEGEHIMPAPGSEAQITTYDQANGVVINYYFPVEIEVIGALNDEQIRSVTEYVFDELSRELDSRM